MRKGAGVIRIMAYIMLSGGLLMASWMDRKDTVMCIIMYGGGACPGPVCSPCRKDGISEPGLRQQDLQPCNSWYLVICTEGRTAMLFRCVHWRNVLGIPESYGRCVICCWR